MILRFLKYVFAAVLDLVRPLTTNNVKCIFLDNNYISKTFSD